MTDWGQVQAEYLSKTLSKNEKIKVNKNNDWEQSMLLRSLSVINKTQGSLPSTKEQWIEIEKSKDGERTEKQIKVQNDPRIMEI